MFKHDNAPPHRAAIVTQCLNANQIPTLQWPLLSSDLSPIEHTWDVLGRRARDPLPPASLEDLQHRLIARVESHHYSDLIVESHHSHLIL